MADSQRHKDNGKRERHLIERLRGDSREAFDEIYRMYAGRLLSYCRAITKDKETAKEITQIAFIKLWDARRSIRTDDNIGSLIFRMARNEVIDAFRAQLRRGAYEDYLEYIDQVPANDSSTSRIEYHEFVEKLMKALDCLPPTQRQAITLCRLQGLGNQEAARRLNLSEQTVRNQLSLGLKRLYELLR
ncbi:MAG: RNA polymerase sigma factor [[Clostridium] fimetarium]|nr:RNA polymerase sigma factor [Alistipes timonensis]MCM1405530.1 RNA polymerase sigma factor [[Clostridium] fimetarium]